MDKIRLVSPSPEMEKEVLDYRKEHFENNESFLHGGALLDRIDSYSEWLQHLKNSSKKETLTEGWVLSSTFLGIRESDNRIVGIIDIRHYLNDFLANYAGHIGYGVRPTERSKGYATAMLELALEYCRSLGLDKVMLACEKDNRASAKTILRFNGQLEREFEYTDGSIIQIYWISL